ncbi:MAG TPA: inorganic phosphate transporter [Campylobacterales bacterium]|nr:inorganic phosphate transporter [Campylobacterales bacterium]
MNSVVVKTILGFLFMVAVAIWVNSNFGNLNNSFLLILASFFGAYMAMNIGANDVANNVGPAVGAKVITITGAVIIAAIFEASGALIAGGDVVGTIKKKIIDPALFSPDEFVLAMSAALLAAAAWLNLATYFKAPVSTTHSIVGGVMGAGIAAAGFSIVEWGTMGKIVLSWIVSPVLGGLIAATFLYIIKKSILFKDDKLEASKKFVPILVSVMAWAFGTYLVMKGLKKVWPDIVDIFTFLPDTKKPTFLVASIIGLAVAGIVFLIVKPIIAKSVEKLGNSRESVNSLFAIPLIFAAALLSFSHGANDVANAVGPLAGIYDTIVTGDISTKAPIPLWVMAVGGLGISVGLLLFGPRLIQTVGSEITEIDAVRAYSIAMAAAITVIIASQLGLPVSSTHIAVGGVFGVGFLREFLASNEKYVERGFVSKIIAAWVITVPVAGVLAGIIFYILKAVF